MVTANPSDIEDLTIEDLAFASGTTTRSIRSFQTLGLLDHPDLRGRTGIYRPRHLDRIRSILALQSQGFSMQSLAVLFDAHERGASLQSVLGLEERERTGHSDPAGDNDEAERYGFGELQRNRVRRRGRPLLAIVPTTLWNETAAS